MANLTRSEKQDVLLTLIDRFEDSVRDLNEIGREEDADCISDMIRSLNDELTEIEGDEYDDEQAELRAMNREYYRSVL